MKYKLTAIRQNGEHYEEIKDAPDKFSIYREIKESGATIISITETSDKKFKSFKFWLENTLSRVGANEKISFGRNLGKMLEAGLPLIRALSVMEKQTKNPKLKSIFAKMQDDINKGGTLSKSLADFPKVFPPLFVSMVKAGEESGSIAGSLKSVADQLEKIHILVKRLRGAMIYPAIIVSVMIIIGILLLVFLVPTLTQTFGELNLELPFATRVIIAASNFLKNNFLISIGIVLVILFSMYSGLKTKKGKRFLSYLLLKIPLISSLVRESNSAKTARTLSSLLSAGVDFLIAIRITREVVENPFYREILKQAEENVQKGNPISEVF